MTVVRAACAAALCSAAASFEQVSAFGERVDRSNANPGVVAVVMSKGGKVSRCSAYAVSPSVLLSGAHCFYGGGKFATNVKIYVNPDDTKRRRVISVPKGNVHVPKEFRTNFDAIRTEEQLKDAGMDEKKASHDAFLKAASNDVAVIVTVKPHGIPLIRTVLGHVSFRNIVNDPAVRSGEMSMSTALKVDTATALFISEHKGESVMGAGYGMFKCSADVVKKREAACKADWHRRYGPTVIKYRGSKTFNGVYPELVYVFEPPPDESSSASWWGDSGGPLSLGGVALGTISAIKLGSKIGYATSLVNPQVLSFLLATLPGIEWR